MNDIGSKKITELVEYLNVCRDKYYNDNKPIISDKEYDCLFDKLKELENETGIILSNSPTQTVGYNVVSSLEKVEHVRPLLSLDKTKSISELIKFCGGKDVLFMHKLDGLTVDLTYRDGKLFRAETRGNGIIGEDITHNAITFLGVPKTIKYKEEVHLTGEAIITYNDFERINNNLSKEDQYANPRNLASGSVRQLDSSICAKRHVRFVVWNSNDISIGGTMESGLLNAEKLGFTVVNFYKRDFAKDISESSIEETIKSLKEEAKDMSFPIDGIVVMFNDIEYGKSLGTTAHHPRNGIAYKFYDDVYETKLMDIKWSIGKTSTLTPVAIFDPVEIDGTTVKQASLSNISVMEETLGIPFDGEILYVSKRGSIIPKIESADKDDIIPNSKLFNVPDKCYCCGSDTAVKVSRDGIKTLKCTNTLCVGTVIKKLCAFVSKSAMDIDGLSEKTIEKIVNIGWVRSYSDIYTEIPNHANELSAMEGFGNQSVSELLKSIEASKNTTLSKILIGMNIDNIGKQTAIDLSKFFNDDYNNILKADKNTIRQKLLSIKGFGEVLANSIYDWLSDENSMKEFEKLCGIMQFKTKNTSDNLPLSGMKFVITGSLKLYKNRDELVKVIEENGGNVLSSVTSETTYLINNDINSTSSKNAKAKKLGKTIITEQNFVDMISGNNTTETTKPERKSLF